MTRRLLGLLAFVTILIPPILASAQVDLAAEHVVADEHGIYLGVGAGLGASLRVGVRDAFAEDADLRLDVHAGVYAGNGAALGGGVSFQTLFSPGDPSLRPYVGGGLDLAYVEEFQLCLFGGCNAPWSGAFAGPRAVVGFEAGGPGARFFLEIGGSVLASLAGDASVPDFVVQPRAELGVHFL